MAYCRPTPLSRTSGVARWRHRRLTQCVCHTGLAARHILACMSTSSGRPTLALTCTHSGHPAEGGGSDTAELWTVCDPERRRGLVAAVRQHTRMYQVRQCSHKPAQCTISKLPEYLQNLTRSARRASHSLVAAATWDETGRRTHEIKTQQQG